ncbi:MAG: hypothetical protein NVS4B7_21860 [Ktedonobacteraceae bacterium]
MMFIEGRASLVKYAIFSLSYVYEDAFLGSERVLAEVVIDVYGDHG